MDTDLPDADEAARLDALRQLALVGTPPEPAFDRLVRLATSVIDVPIALITLIESDRAWYKARVGTDLAETSREASFCTHTIEQDDNEPFVVEDTWLDERFESNPLVTGNPRARFYAGVPLRSPDGHALGTLSVIDRQPRTISARERLALADLASLAEELMAVRWRAAEAEASAEADADVAVDAVEPVTAEDIDAVDASSTVEQADDDQADINDVATVEYGGESARRLALSEVMLEHINDVVVVVDGGGRITAASPSFGHVLGYGTSLDHRGDSTEDAFESAFDLIHTDDRAAARRQLAAVIEGTAGTEPFNVRVLTASGSIRNMECTAVGMFDMPAVAGVVITLRDVSERHLLSQMLNYQSTHDRVTGLPNRTLLLEHLRPAMARAARENSVVAVCHIEIEGLRELGHELGAEAADELLVDVARRITTSIRTGDSAARLDGGHFAVLLDPVADPSEAAAVARRIVTAVSGPHSLQAGVSNCGANAGVAISRDTDDIPSLLARAGRALDTAKGRGGGEVELASSLDPGIADRSGLDVARPAGTPAAPTLGARQRRRAVPGAEADLVPGAAIGLPDMSAIRRDRRRDDAPLTSPVLGDLLDEEAFATETLGDQSLGESFGGGFEGDEPGSVTYLQQF